jgi:outer membrane lipoprotein carrier protein
VKKAIKYVFVFPHIAFGSIFIIFCLLLTSGVSHAVSVEEALQKIQKSYENIQDMSGSFVQKSYIKDLNRTDTFKGQFFIKMPKKMRVNYSGENPSEVVIKNEEITIYQKNEKQAIIGRFDSSTYGQTPVVLLSGFGKIQEEFTVTNKKNKLFLKPKKPMGIVVSIEIQTADEGFPIQSFVIHDTYSNRIEITLKDVKINTGLKDAFFTLSFPKGVTVLDHRP